jgi:hypothetical protein
LGHGALLSLERPSLGNDRNILLFEGCVCALEQYVLHSTKLVAEELPRTPYRRTSTEKVGL